MAKYRVGEVLIVTRRVCKHAAHLIGTECRVEKIYTEGQDRGAYPQSTEYIVSCIDGSDWGAAEWHLRRISEPPPINRWAVKWEDCAWQPKHLRKEATEEP